MRRHELDGPALRAALSPTPDLLGTFVDDYGITYTVTPET